MLHTLSILQFWTYTVPAHTEHRHTHTHLEHTHYYKDCYGYDELMVVRPIFTLCEPHSDASLRMQCSVWLPQTILLVCSVIRHPNCGIPTYACGYYLYCIQEVQRRFPDGLPQLDPVQDMNIRDDDFRSIIRVSRILAYYQVIALYPDTQGVLSLPLGVCLYHPQLWLLVTILSL